MVDNPFKDMTDDELITAATRHDLRKKYRYSDEELMDIAVYSLEEMRKRKISKNAEYGKTDTVIYECHEIHDEPLYPQCWIMTTPYYNYASLAVIEQMHRHFAQWP